ncbi:MAG: Trm112 family protein [Myxococcales bacterium]|nr:Trm112 family protein [Myxococcales bacterium]
MAPGGQHARVSLAPELLAVLACPEAKAPLVYFGGGEAGDRPAEAFLFCPASRLRYRIDGDIPVLLIEEAERLDERAAARLVSRAQELGLANA